MNLEVSTWTRRERLERIAAAERDRRAGRSALALASLGEAAEWPARIVLALIRLPEGEGSLTRELLVSTLDEWAEETGLAPLDGVVPDEVEPVPADAAAPEAVAPAPGADASFAEPIEVDEFDRAFAEAEALTEEMLDVNSVAARVLMSEPMGLSEIGDPGPDEPLPGEPIETGAAWVAIPEGDAGDAREERGGRVDRSRQIAILEHWLANLERRRTTHQWGGAR